ncbi:MAG: hypothetical protein J5I90_07615 [Caldilineales bacterium]|nr:hypothetical protein [Caldilineales bacterium]
MEPLAALPEIEIRLSNAADAAALRRLAMLENRHGFEGPALIAFICGRPAAALKLDGSDVVADPFVPTAALIQAMRAVASPDPGRPNRHRLLKLLPGTPG